MKEQITNKIINYFKENEEVFNDCIEELDSYNGYLCDDRYYPMEYINDFYNSTDPLDILYRAYYGRDDDTYATDASGNKTHGEFNPNREYFKYNAYGNLVSTDYKDYTDRLDEYFIDELLEHRAYIYSIESDEDLTALFNELEEYEEE